MTVDEMWARLAELIRDGKGSYKVVCFDGCCGPVEFTKVTEGVNHLEIWVAGYTPGELETMVGLE